MVISTGRFMYHKPSKCFTAEMSELQLLCKSPFQPIQNTKHHGLTLISQRTHTRVDYYLHEIVRDNEGEIQFWLLFPTEMSSRLVPSCRGTQIRIYND